MRSELRKLRPRKASYRFCRLAKEHNQCKRIVREGQTLSQWALKGSIVEGIQFSRSYPRTLILENESTALPAVGLPIAVAGRKIVKISMFFNGVGSC